MSSPAAQTAAKAHHGVARIHHALAHRKVHHSFLHRLFHPHIGRHIHIGAFHVSAGSWQLILWVGTVPAAWALFRFVYLRRPGHRRVAFALLGAVVVLQATAFLSFALWRNADVLFFMMWLSLISLIAGLSLLPDLRLTLRRRAQNPAA